MGNGKEGNSSCFVNALCHLWNIIIYYNVHIAHRCPQYHQKKTNDVKCFHFSGFSASNFFPQKKKNKTFSLFHLFKVCVLKNKKKIGFADRNMRLIFGTLILSLVVLLVAFLVYRQEHLTQDNLNYSSVPPMPIFKASLFIQRVLKRLLQFFTPNAFDVLENYVISVNLARFVYIATKLKIPSLVHDGKNSI